MVAEPHIKHRVIIYGKSGFADQYMPISNTEWRYMRNIRRRTYQTPREYKRKIRVRRQIHAYIKHRVNIYVKCTSEMFVKWANRDMHAEEMPSMYVDGCRSTYQTPSNNE